MFILNWLQKIALKYEDSYEIHKDNKLLFRGNDFDCTKWFHEKGMDTTEEIEELGYVFTRSGEDWRKPGDMIFECPRCHKQEEWTDKDLTQKGQPTCDHCYGELMFKQDRKGQEDYLTYKCLSCFESQTMSRKAVEELGPPYCDKCHDNMEIER